MPVTHGHFSLTPEQRQSKQLLDQFPSLGSFWDFQARGCNVTALERAIPAMSHGEQIMARFLASVWLGQNRFDFDLFDAAATLDSPHQRIITDWLSKPTFP